MASWLLLGTGYFLCSLLLPHLPSPHSPSVIQLFIILAAGDIASNKANKAPARKSLILGKETIDKNPNWQGGPLLEIEFLIGVQALGPWTGWGQR